MPDRKSVLNNNFWQPFKYVSAILLFYLVASWFVSDPVRAGKIDRYILYYIDDIFHYCYVRMASVDPVAALNPYAKPFYTVIGMFFYKLLPVGILSLRIMNSLLSAGTLFIQYKLMEKIGVKRRYIILSLFMTATFPIYFLSSVSSLTEIMFGFLLVLAVYLLYAERYFLSSFCVSLLPLVRHEGFLYLVIWIYFLSVKKKAGRIIFLFIPIAVWIFLNYSIFGRPVEYSLLHHIYLIAKKINVTPPPQTVSGFFNTTSLMSITYQPLFILAVCGWLMKLKDRYLTIVSICWISCMSFLFIFTIIHIAAFKTISRELRYIVPLIPFMSLYSIYPIEKTILKFRSGSKYPAVIYGAIFAFIFLQLPVNLRLLQHDEKVKEEALTPAKEAAVAGIGAWLNDYLTKNSIDNVYVSGKFTADKYIRRIWMYLDKNKKFYPTINPFATEPKGEIKPLDIVNFNILRSSDMKGIFIIFNASDNDQLGRQEGWVLIKSFPDIPLNFYLTG